MADIKISELGAALTVGDSDVLPMTASGVTSKVSTSLLKDYVIGTTDISTIGDGTVTGAIDAINTDMPDGLDDLDDVSITTPVDGEAPVYDSVSQKFKNTAIVTQDEFGDVIAPIEVSPSAHAYSVGKQLLYNDVLYTVTSPIAVSDALTEGTNITASDTVIEQVEDNISDISDLHDEFYDAWKKNGAYNLLENHAVTAVSNGITFTVSSDGTVDVNGTLTTTTAYIILSKKETHGNLPIANGAYKFVGCPSSYTGTASLKCNLYNPDGSTSDFPDTGSGVSFNYVSGSNYNVSIIVSGEIGQTINHATIKPMITTDLNATYDDFVEYAMTNRELTELAKSVSYNALNVADKTGDFSDSITNVPNGEYIAILRIRSKSSSGNISTEINLQECTVITNAAQFNHYVSMTKVIVTNNTVTFHSKTYTTATLQDAYIALIPLS